MDTKATSRWRGPTTLLGWAAVGVIATVLYYVIALVLMFAPIEVDVTFVAIPVLHLLSWPTTLVLSLCDYLQLAPHFGFGPEGLGRRLEFFLNLIPVSFVLNAVGYALLGWVIRVLRSMAADGLKPHRRKALWLGTCTAVVLLGLLLHVPVIRATAALLLRSGDPELRREGANVMYWLGPRCAPAGQHLQAAAKDPDETVRKLIVGATGRCENPDPLLDQILTNALHDSSIMVRCEAARALIRGKRLALPALLSMVESAATASERDMDRIDWVLRGLPHELDESVALRTVEAIARIPDSAAKSRIVETLRFNWTISDMLDRRPPGNGTGKEGQDVQPTR